MKGRNRIIELHRFENRSSRIPNISIFNLEGLCISWLRIFEMLSARTFETWKKRWRLLFSNLPIKFSNSWHPPLLFQIILDHSICSHPTDVNSRELEWHFRRTSRIHRIVVFSCFDRTSRIPPSQLHLSRLWNSSGLQVNDFSRFSFYYFFFFSISFLCIRLIRECDSIGGFFLPSIRDAVAKVRIELSSMVNAIVSTRDLLSGSLSKFPHLQTDGIQQGKDALIAEDWSDESLDFVSRQRVNQVFWIFFFFCSLLWNCSRKIWWLCSGKMVQSTVEDEVNRLTHVCETIEKFSKAIQYTTQLTQSLVKVWIFFSFHFLLLCWNFVHSEYSIFPFFSLSLSPSPPFILISQF